MEIIEKFNKSCSSYKRKYQLMAYERFKKMQDLENGIEIKE